MKAINVLKGIVKIIIVLLLIAALALLIISNVVKYKEKKAIIFLPGLLASGLINEEKGKPVWDPFVSEWNIMDMSDESTMMSMIGDFAVTALSENMLGDILSNSPDSIFNQIAMDENGVPVNKHVVPADFDTCETGHKYGALRSFQRAYEAVNARYKNSGADIRIYNYDWRIDNRISAANLEKFINEKGYDKVVLIGHSMGNVVIANYLARSEANRNKTIAHLSYAGPMYGSLSALTTLEDFEGMAQMLYDIVDKIPLLGSGIRSEIDRVFAEQFTPLGMHIPTIAQLLPSPEMFDTPYCEGNKSFLYIDGRPVKTREELLSFYKTRKWSYTDDGSKVKCFVDDLGEYWDSFYVDTENGKVHASTLVPTYYFAGVGTKTTTAVYIENDKFVRTGSDMQGDGTVPYYSATLNNTDKVFTESANKSDSRYVVSVPVKNHGECGCDFKNETERETFAYLDEALKVDFAEFFKNLFA